MLYPHTVLQTLDEIELDIGESKRMNCPFCSGKYTFTISRMEEGVVLYNCYRATCYVRGKRERKLYGADLKKKLDKTVQKGYNFKSDVHFTVITNNNRAIKWLQDRYALEAFVHNRVDIKWDAAAERIAFMMKENGEIIDAIGTPLNKKKWWRYGSSKEGLIVPHYGEYSEHPIYTPSVGLVEDAPSACNISNIMDALAMCGVQLTDEMRIKIFENWSQAIIILDPDAQGRALKIKRQLDSFVDTHILSLSDDAKNIPTRELKEIFDTWITKL